MLSRCILSAALALAIAAPTFAQRGPLKIFISADMEGITGVVTSLQLTPEGSEYARFRRFMTDEVNAAIEAAQAAGATEIVVSDSHGNMQNLLLEELNPAVRVVRGRPRPLGMVQGLDESFHALIFIGYHASENIPNAVRSHTFSSARLLSVVINGKEVSEGIINAAVAGHYGVPIAFISGDRAAVKQLQEAAPWVEGAIVKEPLGYHSAITLVPSQGRELIRQGVRRALERLPEMRPYVIAPPVELEVGFKSTLDAEQWSFLPNVVRLDAHTIRLTFPDIVQAYRFMGLASHLEQHD